MTAPPVVRTATQAHPFEPATDGAEASGVERWNGTAWVLCWFSSGPGATRAAIGHLARRRRVSPVARFRAVILRTAAAYEPTAAPRPERTVEQTFACAERHLTGEATPLDDTSTSLSAALRKAGGRVSMILPGESGTRVLGWSPCGSLVLVKQDGAGPWAYMVNESEMNDDAQP